MISEIQMCQPKDFLNPPLTPIKTNTCCLVLLRPTKMWVVPFWYVGFFVRTKNSSMFLHVIIKQLLTNFFFWNVVAGMRMGITKKMQIGNRDYLYKKRNFSKVWLLQTTFSNVLKNKPGSSPNQLLLRKCFEILHFLNMCPIFLNFIENFNRSDNHMIDWKIIISNN